MNKYTIIIVVLLVAFGLGFAGLYGYSLIHTDGEWEKRLGFNKEYSVELYSGGKLVKSYVSTGKVSSEANSDGYFFKDKATGVLVEISGTLVIEQVNDN